MGNINRPAGRRQIHGTGLSTPYGKHKQGILGDHRNTVAGFLLPMGNIKDNPISVPQMTSVLSTPYGKHKRSPELADLLTKATFYSLWET